MLNRGFSGYNTDWALPVLDQVRIGGYRRRLLRGLTRRGDTSVLHSAKTIALPRSRC